MKLIGLNAEMNDDTKRITLSFYDAAPPDHPDPAAFVPTVRVTIHLPPGQVDIVPLEPTPTPHLVEEDDGPARSDSSPTKG